MPIYEYRCQSCGKEFEEWQKFSISPVEKCGDCGGKTCRLISQSTFVLKGTGWDADSMTVVKTVAHIRNLRKSRQRKRNLPRRRSPRSQHRRQIPGSGYERERIEVTNEDQANRPPWNRRNRP